MTLLLVLGAALVFLSIYLVSTAITDAEAKGLNRSLAVLEAMSSGPKELTKDLDKDFADRVLAPMRKSALRIGRRLTGADAGERIRHKLDLAGNPPGWTVDRVVSGKIIGLVAGVAGAFVFSLLIGPGLSLRILMLAGGAVVGYFAPSMYLYQKAHDRSNLMQRELPDAIDLLTISVESGLGFDAALQQVAKNTEGPLADEFSRMLREMQIGSGRSASLRAMGDRTNVPELRGFVSAMVQADAFGIPIAQVLRVQSSEIRVKRRQRAEQKAQQVPVKITIPLIFCILPTLFIAVMGPAAIGIMASFGS
jgi:tight adherence protein C